MLDFIDAWLANPIALVGLLIGGFVALVYGADWLVDGASGLAKRFNISDLVIGLTVVAFGTSMPEFVVNMISSGQGNSELAITNILGSNAINIFVVLGLTAVIWPVTSRHQTRTVDLPFAILAAVLILFFASFTMPLNFGDWSNCFHLRMDGDEYISRYAGIVICFCFVVYMVYLARHAKETPEEAETFTPMNVGKALLLIVVGLAGLSIGGDLVVKTATAAAQQLGVSDAIIGLTIVALGTSLPELAASCMAAYKHNSDMALGNCVGSCIFNVYFVLGISTLVHPLKAYPGIGIDAFMALLGPALVLLFVGINRQRQISRWAGAILLVVYAIYLTLRIIAI